MAMLRAVPGEQWREQDRSRVRCGRASWYIPCVNGGINHAGHVFSQTGRQSMPLGQSLRDSCCIVGGSFASLRFSRPAIAQEDMLIGRRDSSVVFLGYAQFYWLALELDPFLGLVTHRRFLPLATVILVPSCYASFVSLGKSILSASRWCG